MYSMSGMAEHSGVTAPGEFWPGWRADDGARGIVAGLRQPFPGMPIAQSSRLERVNTGTRDPVPPRVARSDTL